MKFTTICLIATTFIDASVCVAGLGNRNKCLFQSSIQLASKQCNPNIFTIKQNFHIGTPSGEPLRLTTCNKIVQQPAPQQQHCQQQQKCWKQQYCQQQQPSSTCENCVGDCTSQPRKLVGILVPNSCPLLQPIHKYNVCAH